MRNIEEFFEVFATRMSALLGSGVTFVIATTAVVASLCLFDNVAVNLAISIATLMMVFLLQNTANRSDDEMHEKLDKLLRSIEELDEDD